MNDNNKQSNLHTIIFRNRITLIVITLTGVNFKLLNYLCVHQSQRHVHWEVPNYLFRNKLDDRLTINLSIGILGGGFRSDDFFNCRFDQVRWGLCCMRWGLSWMRRGLCWMRWWPVQVWQLTWVISENWTVGRLPEKKITW